MTSDIIDQESKQEKPHQSLLILRSKEQRTIGNFISLMIAQTLCKLQKNCGKGNGSLLAFVLSSIFMTLGGSDQREREIGNGDAGEGGGGDALSSSEYRSCFSYSMLLQV